MSEKKAGRKQIAIDWAVVDNYLAGGSSGAQIAGALGINKHTLYRRCEKEHNSDFANYANKKRQKGNALLNYKQFQVAMEGNVSMLIWLGKQRLGQQNEPKVTEGFDGKLGEFLDHIKNMKKGEMAFKIFSQ